MLASDTQWQVECVKINKWKISWLFVHTLIQGDVRLDMKKTNKYDHQSLLLW